MTLVYRLIDEESQRQPVSLLCRALGVARSGFYEWQRSPVSDRQISDWLLTEQIRAIFEASDETYGSPRVHAELLLDHGVRVSSKRVARLMRQHGFRSVWAKRPRSYQVTLDGLGKAAATQRWQVGTSRHPGIESAAANPSLTLSSGMSPERV